ncbi:valine--tRNA ligase [Candidatus Woesearchaeota archaeon]|nr:valine--tRNA ligase [Candidatus Woesearchaeota archaeon]|tara:strand:- start:6171 stop:8588 length:2418 start_codon:yes stop_codon:yes gene_type:complete
MELPKNYNPKGSEPKWIEFWEKEKIYAFDPKSKAEIYSVDTPPPTLSGKMHIGHSFSYSQQDFIVRFQRMIGKNIFYPFGTDDNGLATIRMIEKMKKVKGVKMGRKEFVDLCLKTLKEIRPQIVYDWKRIGVSADFDVFYTTIDGHSQKISQKSFLDLHKMGRIYRKKAPFVWCPECQTAIAQVEMKDSERASNMVYMKFDTDAGKQITIATTRPELLPACVAIHIHPDDKRYNNLIGAKAKIPFSDRTVTIEANKDVDMEFGSGIVYHCTYGDMDDVKWMEEFNIEPIEILNKNGVLNEKAGRFKGLHVKKARAAVIKALEEEGRIEKLDPIKHVVNVHERCETDIEILNTEQWFIKYLDLKGDFIKYGKKIKWYPDHMRVRYDNWVNGLKWDWNISRQRDFGIPIPVWYCKKCSEIIVADEKQLPVDPIVDKPNKKCKCGSDEFIGEKDTLDTWATSSLTPEIAIELFKDKKLQKKLFPMSLRPQAHDIITFWLFNTVVKSYFHHKNVPWDNVMISGFALDPKGKKMSKSKGNVVDPRDMISKYSADSLRFWASGSRLGDDLPFLEKDLVTGNRFITKIWNASKFAFMHLADYKGKKPAKLEMIDMWILSKLSKVVKKSTQNFTNYEYSHTKLDTETFFWHTFCDNYLELIKDRLYNPDKRGSESKLSAQYGLYNSLLTILKLIAPIMPFITEELYQLYFKKHEKEKSIHLTKWPEIKLIDDHAEHIGDFVVKVVEFVRKEKTAKQVSLKAPVKKLTIKAKIEEIDFDKVEADIKATTSAETIIFEPTRGTKPDTDVDISIEF